VSRSFELLQLASVQTFQQHVRMPLSVQLAMGFPSKTQICEDSCNRPDDVDSYPDALIHKASCAFKIQTFGRRSSWFGRASFIYENYVQLKCDLSNDRATPSGRGSIQERIYVKFGKPIAQLSVRTPYVYSQDGA
jgi:hypothetical protein